MVKIEDILQNVVSAVLPGDHIIDDSFLRNSIKETNLEMSYRAFTPFAVCINPKCVSGEGFALLFYLDDGETGWVFVPHEMFLRWLEELDELPSDDSWWSWTFISNYYWKGYITNVQKG